MLFFVLEHSFLHYFLQTLVFLYIQELPKFLPVLNTTLAKRIFIPQVVNCFRIIKVSIVGQGQFLILMVPFLSLL